MTDYPPPSPPPAIIAPAPLEYRHSNLSANASNPTDLANRIARAERSLYNEMSDTFRGTALEGQFPASPYGLITMANDGPENRKIFVKILEIWYGSKGSAFPFPSRLIGANPDGTSVLTKDLLVPYVKMLEQAAQDNALGKLVEAKAMEEYGDLSTANVSDENPKTQRMLNAALEELYANLLTKLRKQSEAQDHDAGGQRQL